MKVTAIISAYYAEKYLERKIENLLSQSLIPQIMVVAKRGSKEEAIAGVYGLAPILTDDIPTVYSAWNLGIQASDGEFITNANSDDVHYEGAIEKLANTLEKEKHYAMAYFNVDRIESLEDPKTIGRFEWGEGGLKELYWNGCFLGPMPMWRRSLHEKYGLFDGVFHTAGDYEFWMRLAAGGEKFFHIKQVLGAHLERADSLEHRSGLRSTWESAKARAEYRQLAEERSQ